MRFGWLHVSDLHLQDNDNYDRDIVLRQLVARVREAGRAGQMIDAIFVTGDIISHGRTGGYEGATRLLDELCDTTALGRERVFVVPGNHDVQRDRGNFFIRTLRSRVESDAYFNPAQTQHHFERFEAFKRWYDDYFAGVRAFPTNTTCGPVELLEIGRVRIALLPINTALFCRDDADHEKLWVGRRCLNDAILALKALDADIAISLQHHPFSFLHSDERSLIQGKLQDEIDLILRGHLHEQSAQSVCTPTTRAICVAAGAAYQHEHRRKLAYFGQIYDTEARILPLRYYEDVEQWHIDPTLFPSALDKQGRFTIQRLVARGLKRGRSAANQSEAKSPPQATGHAQPEAPPYSAAELASKTSASARDDEDCIRSLVGITGLSRRSVERKLSAADGRVRLKNLFAARWPASLGEGEEYDLRETDEDEAEAVDAGNEHEDAEYEDAEYEDEDDVARDDSVESDESDDADSLDKLANLTAASARRDPSIIRALARLVGLTRTSVRRRVRNASGRAYLRNVFSDYWQDESSFDTTDLGARTTASARDNESVIAAIAELTGLHMRKVRARLRTTDGRYRLRTVFADRWPAVEREADDSLYTAYDLSDWTVASARDHEVAIASLVQITGMSEGGVQRRLSSLDGRVRLRNAFSSRWPDDERAADDGLDRDELGVRTIASVRNDDVAISAIAEIAGRQPSEIRKILSKTDGRRHVRKVFADSWPEDDEWTAGEEQVSYTADELADETAASARYNDEVLDALTKITRLTTATVRRKLRRADGRVRLRNLFGAHWPDDNEEEEELTIERLGARTTASSRGDDEVLTALARVTGLAKSTVQKRVLEWDGRYLLRTLFADEWPDDLENEGEPAAEDDSADSTSYTAEELADWTAASARDDDDALDALTEITGLSIRWVKRHLNNVDGRLHVRNVFAHRWPDADAETEEADRLMHMRVASARDNPDILNALARITHITERGLRRRLNAADGRTHLGTLFEDFWPE